MPLTFGTPFVYSTLVGDVGTEGSIRSWGSHAAIPADQVLLEAQAWIYNSLRAQDMIVHAAIVISPGAQSMVLPSGWISSLALRLDGDAEDLPFSHESWVRFKQADGTMPTGKPRTYMISDKVYFDFEADDGISGLGYAGEHIYYGTPANLSSVNPSNFLCTKYPTLLRVVCTAFAYESRRRLADADEMITRAVGALQQANMSADEFRRGQIGLRG